MSKLNYSNYIFFNDNHNKPDNNTTDQPIKEGIANFCALNRSHNNRRNDIWGYISSNIDKSNAEEINSKLAEKINGELNKKNFPTKYIGIVYRKMTREGADEEITDDKESVQGGRIHIYSADFKKYYGVKLVDSDGIFRSLPDDLIDNPNNFQFAYQDTDGKYFKTLITDGDGEVNVEITDIELPNFGSSYWGENTRDDNGKIINTELKNSGAEERYNAVKLIYNESFTNTINLSIGILVSLYFIAKNR